MQITKTYTTASLEDRHCRALVITTYHGMEFTETDQDICDLSAVFALDIESIGIEGTRRVSRMGYCNSHIPKRYRKWFKLGYMEAKL